MKIDKYLINKDKTDLMSALKQIDNSIIKNILKKNELNSLEELYNYIIDDFKFLIEISKDDIFTRLYFNRLLENENSTMFSAYESDIESLIVFPYKKSGHYSYFIPNEIKKIIKNIFNYHL